MQRFELNLTRIQQLAKDNEELDGLAYAMIMDASALSLGYNKLTKSLTFYDQDNDPICKVANLITGSPSGLVESEELNKLMHFTLEVIPIEDAMESFVKKVKREKIERICDA